MDTTANRELAIFVSGVHSGPNPSPGVGVARSLRQAFPDARLVAVDYSIRSSGIHFQDFDDVVLFRPWRELDLDLHAKLVAELVGENGLWISGLDIETRYLAESLMGDKRFLLPSPKTLDMVIKPQIAARRLLNYATPEYVTLEQSDSELYGFCRRHGWDVWVKGRYYEARRVHNWQELTVTIEALTELWGDDQVFLQAGKAGLEQSILFAAYDGRLLGSVAMRKTLVTDMGKTWSGAVSPLDDETQARLVSVVRDLRWTGGGELEFIKEANQQISLIDWNPRFPAWVFGATIAGHNLPAALVSAATGRLAPTTPALSTHFSRIVYEIPVRSDYTPLPPSDPINLVSLAKHPSGMPDLAQQMAQRSAQSERVSSAPTRPTLLDEEASRIVSEVIASETYRQGGVGCLYLPHAAAQRFADTMRRVKREVSGGQSWQVAYSIKTNPSREVVALALRAGMLAEVISEAEAHYAVALGFRANQLIFNGPQTSSFRDAPHSELMLAAFADTVDTDMPGLPGANVQGIRLRHPLVRSRFGCEVDTPERLIHVANYLGRLPDRVELGVHFHMASSTIGTQKWLGLVPSLLDWASALSHLCGRPITMLDLGGGWYPDDFDTILLPELDRLSDLIKARLPTVHSVVLEPGKALAQPCFARLARVLDIRGPGAQPEEIVLNISIADVVETALYPHRLIHISADGVIDVGTRGTTRLLGNICMESDILCAGVTFERPIARGDYVIFLDVGAYDVSMHYPFGKGVAANA